VNATQYGRKSIDRNTVNHGITISMSVKSSIDCNCQINVIRSLWRTLSVETGNSVRNVNRATKNDGRQSGSVKDGLDTIN